jgi:hypothetical protein
VHGHSLVALFSSPTKKKDPSGERSKVDIMYTFTIGPPLLSISSKSLNDPQRPQNPLKIPSKSPQNALKIPSKFPQNLLKTW